VAGEPVTRSPSRSSSYARSWPLVGLSFAFLCPHVERAPTPAPAPASSARTSRARLPLRFERNVGQEAARVRYAAKARDVSLFLTDDGATMVSSPSHARGEHDVSWTMRVVGRAGISAPVASELAAARSSYFLGNDPARWRTDVPSFGRVTYRDVLPGVNQVFHGEAGALEYDFEVSPGALTKPDAIEIAFEGAESVDVGAAGELRVHAGGAVFVQPSPRVYERSEGQELAVNAAYRVTGRGTIGFDVGAYDESRTLVIDPVLAYATYLGGSGDDYAYGIAVDGAGAMYVAGFTSSPNFPTASAYDATLTGSDDAFVTKLSANGQELVYSTYLGGSQGAYAYGVAVDSAGAAYVIGSTNSTDFPTVTPFQSTLAGALNAFVTKLSPSGSSIVYSTYLGGSGHDDGAGIALDATGAAYVTGTTEDSDFPLPHAATAQRGFGGVSDAFVAKLSPSGSLTYATYVGGSGADDGTGIAVDGSGAAYVTGSTASLDFPTSPAVGPFQPLLNGAQNAFVTKVSPAGSSFAYSTYLGGAQSDQGNAVAIDATGAAYVTGFATSADFPLSNAYQRTLLAMQGGSSAFVSKLDSAGMTLVYSTFLGGTGSDLAEAVAVDANGVATVTGATSSVDFPTVNALQSDDAAHAATGTNAFITSLSATGQSLVYSTYLGGSGGDSAEAIALGPTGAAYVAGFTVSRDFPTKVPLQAGLASAIGDNAFVAVLGAEILADAGPKPFDAGAPGDSGGPPVAAAGDASEPTQPSERSDSGVDASALEITTVGGGGCDCRSAGGADSPGAAVASLLAALAGMLVALRRRFRSLRTDASPGMIERHPEAKDRRIPWAQGILRRRATSE